MKGEGRKGRVGWGGTINNKIKRYGKILLIQK